MTKRKNWVGLLVCGVVLVFSTVSAAAGDHDHDRKGLLLGFNLGLGGANVEFNNTAGTNFKSDTEVGGTGCFRIGYGFNSDFALTFEGRGWTRDYDDGKISLSTYVLEFTWYPAGSGFFLRTGVGGGSAEVEVEVVNPRLVWKEGGSAFTLGFGHEWRLTRTFALGAALDYSALSIDDFATLKDVKAGFTAFTIQFNWYL